MSLQVNWPAWGPDSHDARTWVFWIAAPLLVYAPLCAGVRRHQRRRMVRKHDSLEKMSLDEAYAIKARMAELEFPLTFTKATNFGSFKAQCVPSIAKLVARAVQRSSPSRNSHGGGGGPKFAPADLLSRPGSARRQAAVDRVNRIHDLYRRSGGMTDDDLLYTLWLFCREPLRCAERFEGRAPAVVERRALATLWRALAVELRIPFHRLSSDSSDPDGDLLDGDALRWLAELERWGRDYEERNRERTPEGVFLAEKQMAGWLGNVPAVLRPVARALLPALIEPELRSAMGINNPSKISVFTVEAIVRVRNLARSYLCSPVTLIRGYTYI